MKPQLKLSFPLLIVVSTFLFSCEGFLDIDPPKTQIVRQSVFSNDATATSAIAGIYYQMATTGFSSGNESSVSAITGLSSDELTNYSASADRAMFSSNSLLPKNTIVSSLWSSAYKTIYAANTVIEGVNQSGAMSDQAKQQLSGEAMFVRAFCHFYLTNLFGDAPLVLSTDYNSNASISRTVKSEVLQQVITDLTSAEANLSPVYQGLQRSRPNKGAAQALLARVYMYTGQWQLAVNKASDVIATSDYEILTDPNGVFLATSREAIWQLKPSLAGLSTPDGNTYILTAVPRVHTLSNSLVNAFQAGDKRKTSWVGSFTSAGTTYFFPFKYKEFNSTDPKEASMVLRLAEMFLIRAEARAQLGDLGGALSDLNRIHTRAGLAPLPGFISKDECLQAIALERRFELFTEWGHRWFDLIRTSKATDVLSTLKNPNWQETDVLYPIPQDQIDGDPNMSQNTGY